MTEEEIERILDWCNGNRSNPDAKIMITAPDLYSVIKRTTYVQFLNDKKTFTKVLGELGFDIIDGEDDERPQA